MTQSDLKATHLKGTGTIPLTGQTQLAAGDAHEKLKGQSLQSCEHSALNGIDTTRGWLAEIQLGFADRGDKTVLKQRSQKGPLAVQRPLYPEGPVCHTYLLHPPGGVVGGDQLTITAHVSEGAQALVTTPGATKFYRSAGKLAHQRQILRVAPEAQLEWLPQENIHFPGARVKFNTEIHIAPGGRFIGWEMHCFGRPALNECFETGHIAGHCRVFLDDALVLAEGMNLNASLAQPSRAASLRDFPMNATLLIAGETDELLIVVQDLLNQHHESANKNNLIAGVTQIDGLLAVRALAQGTEPLLQLFTRIWQHTRAHWSGTFPLPPRIWAT
ncbi:urease accessory protein UreD [Photobacterium halotolerans]|uniref:urease accessory protein UreD n=1 Tax=Photobacterium halotolerans TaxID=265726 RepID=UPI0009E39D4E|nr:urease accessory protein UreD [Photobacterium halotolerans]